MFPYIFLSFYIGKVVETNVTDSDTYNLYNTIPAKNFMKDFFFRND